MKEQEENDVEQYSASTYGERIAEVYDELYTTVDDKALALLSDLAGKGNALELGIGTGRLALPLKQRGVAIQGIDASEAMVAMLRQKPGGKEIPVVIGDFTDMDVKGSFQLIYAVFNTFYALQTQEEQLRCFQNVAKFLSNEGVFLLEVFVPDLTRFSQGQTVRLVGQENECVRLDVSQHDLAVQQITSTHVHLSADGIQLIPVKLRYVWPSELDLMARHAGLKLKERWGDWGRAPFTGESSHHISVYDRVV